MDKGSDFLNTTFQKLLAENNIKFYTSQNEDIKCAIVERFNRTLKSRMFQYFTYKSTTRYVDILQDLVGAYNASYHRTIKTTPESVTVDTENEIRSNLTPRKIVPLKWKFELGDKVRLSRAKRAFGKGYLPGWTTEIFTIKTRISTHLPTYEIVDYDGENIAGKFYAEELQKIIKKEDDMYDVEKIIKSRRRSGLTEHFVKWVGYPEKFNSWVSGILPRHGQSSSQSVE